MPDTSETAEATEPIAVEAIEVTAEVVGEKASHLALWLTEWAEKQTWLPTSLEQPFVLTVLLAGLLLASWFVYAVLRPRIVQGMQRVALKTKATWDDRLIQHGFGKWLTHLFPGVILYLAGPGLFSSVPWLAELLRVGSAVYLLMMGFLLIDSVINTGREILAENPAAARVNLAIVTQVIKLIVSLVFLILIISTLLGKSPVVLLGGIGVLASVLMLVFKDVILGFVAGIQLSSNQMLSVGDWLEMPSHSADGDVEEIGLTTVKVRNFDKTITTIPTYALISSPFKNWRGMQESDGRRIKRSLLIDTNSIQLCSREMVDRFRQIEHIAAYVEQKEAEIEAANAYLDDERLHVRVNGRRITNVGTFRAYIEGYLRQHPNINQSMTIIVRQLAPTGQGLPIEIYCFSSNKNWAAYEAIQADIFDHLLAVAQEFDLKVFQQPSGSDFARLMEV